MATKKPEKTRRNFGRSQIASPKVTHLNSSQPVDMQPNATSPAPIPNREPALPIPKYSSETKEAFTHITQIRIDTHLFDSLNNAVESAIFGGNYSIESASHFVREALREHATGMPLKAAHQNGAKKSLSLRLDQHLKSFWDTLPKRHRNNILERAIRTKLLGYHI